jgi:uncharacterized membrane protein YkvI|tara:strand:+ start:2103 stop:3158 length:1056 start_codon:yes stop_codon:yes gene_type:complete
MPGFIFQSVVIAGGYGTGRELAEFFLPFGPRGGILSMMLVSMVFWSLVAAVAFEFSRTYQVYDYRTFCRKLMGPGWILFEIAYLSFLILVLSIIASASGSIFQELFQVSYWVGVLSIMAAIGFLVFAGSMLIEKVLSSWSFILYGTYLIFFFWSLVAFGPEISSSLSNTPVRPGWVLGGIKYAAYNVAIIPVLLFSVRHLKTRRETILAGVLTGPIAIIPGFLLMLIMAGHYPAIAEETVPVNLMLEALGSRSFQILFQLVLFGTLIETGTGMIHGVNERFAETFKEMGKEFPIFARPLIAIVLLVIATMMAQFGLKDLIAKGYGTMTWIFLVVFLIPLLTYGVWKLYQEN